MDEAKPSEDDVTDFLKKSNYKKISKSALWNMAKKRFPDLGRRKFSDAYNDLMGIGTPSKPKFSYKSLAS